MLSNIAAGLRWNASLGIKFLRVVPYFTLVIVMLTLVSQIATLLASFLPLKVIIMLGSDRIPRYFPASFAAVDRDVLIASLCAGTVGFYVLHLLAERMIAWMTGVGTNRLLAKSQKMVLFENQEGVAASSYQRYSRALAGGVFIGLALIGLGWFYPWMSLVIASYFLFSLLLIGCLTRYSTGFHERLVEKLAPTLNVTAGMGFFTAFGFLVLDFIFWNPPGVIVAIVSLLLSRQIMQRTTGMIGDLSALHREKAKLDALFFHGKVLLPQQPQPKKTLWPLLFPEARQEWVGQVLDELAGPDKAQLVCQWQQLGMPNVAGLRVLRGKRQFLVKLFELNRSSLALHEATLISGPPEGLPSPRWVGATQLGKFHCLVFELTLGMQPSTRQVKRLSQQLRSNLLAVRPRSETVRHYMRSKAMLWQRLESNLLERLYVAANKSKERQDLATFLVRLPSLQQQLESLPAMLLNPNMGQDAIWVPTPKEGQEEAPLLLSWGRWSLEPLGAGWPVAEEQLSGLRDALQAGVSRRKELGNVRVEQAEVAALAHALELECNRQRYNQALELIPRMLERMDVLESADLPSNANAG